MAAALLWKRYSLFWLALYSLQFAGAFTSAVLGNRGGGVMISPWMDPIEETLNPLPLY